MVMKDYVSSLRASVDALRLEELEAAAEVLNHAREHGKRVYIFGNGDSATNSLHYAMDLSKGITVDGERRFRSISLNENVPLLTALGNDYGYEQVFKSQLEGLLEVGDVVIGISGSGNSPNVLKGIEYANSLGAVTIGITAMGGGKLKGIAKHSIVVDTDSMEIAEDVHFIIGHMLKMHLISRMKGGKK
ncbi:MAG TPA: SIS domain-containing protein [Candidatus Bilamarchaeaceae archaeon]|nr:SIS domain-containing protein [Candidatus Bilamarchaeaceae archaeon]